MTHIIIVGGGASGIVAGIFAKRKNNQVTILERNSFCLKKILMTGNGKCNYFNETYSMNNYHSHDISIVNKIISDKNINMALAFFEKIGIIPKIKNGYYYPFSNQAVTIKNALLLEAENCGVEIITDCLVKNIEKCKNKFILKTNIKEYCCDKLILASGGCCYPKTGSDGMGYDFLKKMGHSLIEPVPALVQLKSDFKYLRDWNGIRTDVSLSLFENDAYIASEEGEIQLTDFGISGICTFNLSHFVSRGLLEGKKEVMKINFVPFIKTFVTTWMASYSQKNKKKRIGELLEGFLNYKLVDVILKVNHISRNDYYQDLTTNSKFQLCKSLRSFPIKIIGTKSFDNAQVCNGGVLLTEIKTDTMESLIVDNLYIIGELLDINGNCGGYNLTACWISGILAGKSIGDLDD